MGGGWDGGRGGSGGGVRMGWGGVGWVCVYGLEFAVDCKHDAERQVTDRKFKGSPSIT